MKLSVVVALCGLLIAAAACTKKENDENVSADTTTVTGHDTVNGQPVTTTDTVVKTTTTDVDTIHGEPHDTAKKDTTKH